MIEILLAFASASVGFALGWVARMYLPFGPVEMIILDDVPLMHSYSQDQVDSINALAGVTLEGGPAPDGLYHYPPQRPSKWRKINKII